MKKATAKLGECFSILNVVFAQGHLTNSLQRGGIKEITSLYNGELQSSFVSIKEALDKCGSKYVQNIASVNELILMASKVKE